MLNEKQIEILKDFGYEIRQGILGLEIKERPKTEYIQIVSDGENLCMSTPTSYWNYHQSKTIYEEMENIIKVLELVEKAKD